MLTLSNSIRVLYSLHTSFLAIFMKTIFFFFLGKHNPCFFPTVLFIHSAQEISMSLQSGLQKQLNSTFLPSSMSIHAIILSSVHIWSSFIHCLKSIPKKGGLEISAETSHKHQLRMLLSHFNSWNLWAKLMSR